MTSRLLLDLGGAPEADWRAALARSGAHLGAACDGRNVVHRTNEEAPEQIVCLAGALTVELVEALAAWHGTPPCAVVLLTPSAPAEDASAALSVEAGIHHWQALPLAGDAATVAGQVEAACALAQARWRREHALRQALSQTQDRLDERRWVERAKGVLMAARGIGEDEAFRLLRGAAMNVNLRVGELARAVFESAQWADSMNRAGQLRMLSQRLVRLVAQRLLKIEAKAAVVLQRQSTRRVQDNLDTLARQCAATGAQAACTEAARRWEALAEALSAPRLDLPAVARIDAAAEALLAAAERLTEALQAAAGRRALHIVNQCGRQRLRVQRIAKDILLAALHQSSAEAAALAQRRDAALDEFDRAQRELEQAPLSSPEIRATLAQVRDDWLRLLGGLRHADSADGRRALVHASEAMLERLDALTAAYEHSVQVIMG